MRRVVLGKDNYDYNVLIDHDLVLACFTFSLMAVHLPKNIYNFIWRSIHKNQAFNAYMDRVSYLCEMSVFNLLGKEKIFVMCQFQ